jgi:RNA polymerase sigma-70 factor (ECF subfamily)
MLYRELRNRADAEDVMQDVLFLVWRGLDRYVHRGRFGAWIFTIAYRALKSRARSERRGRVVTGVDADTLESSTPELELVASETGAALAAAIGALPERQRHVFLLRHSSELTFAEIAEATGEPLNTVLSHMHYAIEKLKRAVGHNG